MSMVADGRSRLNPNAPIFIPKVAFVEVEDFSLEWWDLVKTSPLFREYWLSQHEEDDFMSSDGDDYDYMELEEFADPDASCFVESRAPKKDRELPNGPGKGAKALLMNLNLDLDVSKSLKGRGGKASVGPPKYCEKKTVSMHVSPKCAAPRRIHQPR